MSAAAQRPGEAVAGDSVRGEEGGRVSVGSMREMTTRTLPRTGICTKCATNCLQVEINCRLTRIRQMGRI